MKLANQYLLIKLGHLPFMLIKHSLQYFTFGRCQSNVSQTFCSADCHWPVLDGLDQPLGNSWKCQESNSWPLGAKRLRYPLRREAHQRCQRLCRVQSAEVAFLATHPGSNPKSFSRVKFDVAEVNQRRCFKSGQWLENVHQTHFVLVSGKSVLQKVLWTNNKSGDDDLPERFHKHQIH